MFHGSCRKVSKVLSLALEPISKSAVHYLAKRVSEIRVSKEPRYRRCIAVDETKLRVKKSYVYVWSAVDVDSKELLALEASYGRSSLNALSFLKKALKMCTNKPLVIVDKGPWYRWAFERLGLEYRHERFGMRNRVERFFRYLKERTIVFHHKLSARDHIQGITNLKLFLSLFTLYYQACEGEVNKNAYLDTIQHHYLRASHAERARQDHDPPGGATRRAFRPLQR
jgi:putative transposase